ncbi:amino acid ABC transporter permease [Paeniglutamicibacter kerguelensis]|uniref:Glutamate transport system permease protein n=1 Tax=Paeniglutamicibacter kerguelensis TaxID=254788 RepID=A0ABS4XE60_9MICC|nr:amino acid ABC transporter permease [Paeniglutamicibacter kerguelensis]MBP2386764.1 glutamate transport system permease protein [Paeniglutamicibacter kerguelensis]
MSASVLFDTPGPKARRRILLINVIGILLIAGLLFVVVAGLAAKGQMDPELWASLFTSNAWVNFLLPGLLNTLKAAGLGIVLSVTFGLAFGMGLLAQAKALRWFSTIIVEFFRAVPVLLMIVFLNILLARTGMVNGTDSPFWAVVISLMLYNGSVIAELVRSGVRNLPKGQREAGIAIGLTTTQSLRLIEIPQALVAMLPALIGQFVVILKDSALGYIIGFTEFLFFSRTFAAANGNMLQALLLAAAVFIIINFSLGKLAEFVSRRLSSRMPSAKEGANPATDIEAPITPPVAPIDPKV